MYIRHLLHTLLLLCIVGCSNDSTDTCLSKIAEQIDLSPETALASLDSIDSNLLSYSDRYYYDFLTIKASDKAYITHTSDSLIQQVIHYYSNHHDNSIYPEVLYYGGRVYSDLGDYPTSLRYFQESLDAIPQSEHYGSLKKRVLSQTGRTLDKLRLFEQAIPYVSTAIEIHRHNNETTDLIYDLQLLGGIYLRAKRYDLAERYFSESLEIARRSDLPERFAAKSRMYLAATYYDTGNIDSALILIRNTPDQVLPPARNSALAYASNIYLAAGMPDSAYRCAYQIIHSNNPLNKNVAYQNILAPELQHLIPIDSARQYISDYRIYMEDELQHSGDKAALLQNSLYNYTLHERERIKAEQSKQQTQIWLLISFASILIMLIAILMLKNRNKSQCLELHKVLDDLSILKHNLHSEANGNTDTEIVNNNISSLRERLRTELLSLYESDNVTETPISIIQTDAYRQLHERIMANRHIPDNCTLWDELEKAVITSSPQFVHRLRLLTGGKLKPSDIRIALLVKCGVTPTQIATLIGRTKGTVSYQRETLCKKIFDQQLGAKVIDGIIRLL